ncbi:hypothetical protein CBI38_20525 [Rhodococcus oxybenzonivorans]|uniref:Uncharacterized protein n=2 Tax=Rhodococcus oxybenzonivorans TaxID=1990687 RepID=A0A2S2C4A7_9NOCA|nr:hypothetical protein CBI38_20525 [Rhodococcus oxybenzonivorans]
MSSARGGLREFGHTGAKEKLMTTESPKPRAGARFVDAFLQSPFAGLTPWIVMSLLSGPGRFEESVAAALALSILFLFLSHRRGGALKPLEVFDIVYFGCLAAIGLFASDTVITWLETWSGEMSSLALVVFAFGSLLLRNPFTLPYAKETTPEEYWSSPLFLAINQRITLVWALSFTVSGAAGLFGDAVLRQPDNFWTGWIIPIGALLFALSFTEWYPDVATARAPREPGEPEEVAPPLLKLFEFLPPFLMGVGIAMLVTDNDPDWLAIALIVVGIVAGAAFRRTGARRPAASAG